MSKLQVSGTESDHEMYHITHLLISIHNFSQRGVAHIFRFYRGSECSKGGFKFSFL